MAATGRTAPGAVPIAVVTGPGSWNTHNDVWDIRIPGRAALLPLLTLLAASAASAQLSAYPGRSGERHMPAAQARSAIEACANPSLPIVGNLTAEDVGLLGYGLAHPGAAPAYCRHGDLGAALAFLEAYAGDPIRLDTGAAALSRLVDLYNEIPADPRAMARRDEIRRVQWLRGLYSPPAGDPLLTAAEQRRLLTDPRNLEFLRAWVARDMQDSAARIRLAQALLLEGAPQFDPTEAASILPSESNVGDLRLRLVAELVADRRNFALAFEQLRFVRWNRERLSGAEAVAMNALVDRASRLLERDDTRLVGARILGILAENAVTEARIRLLAMIERQGGMLDAAGSPREVGPFSSLITADDYPASARRNLEQGVVRPSAIFGPDGELVMIDTGPGELNVLDYAVARIWRRRWLQRVRLEGHPGRFVRLAGPTVLFRLPDCRNGSAQPLPPPNPAYVTVDGECIRAPNLTTYVH